MEQRGRAGYSEMGKSGSREGSVQTYHRNTARRHFPTLPDTSEQLLELDFPAQAQRSHRQGEPVLLQVGATIPPDQESP